MSKRTRPVRLNKEELNFLLGTCQNWLVVLSVPLTGTEKDKKEIANTEETIRKLKEALETL